MKQPQFTYSVSGPFTYNKERIQKYEETGCKKFIYRNELDKACFQHDMGYGDFKDLTRRTASDKILWNKAFNIAKNEKYDGYQRGLALMIYRFFDKKYASLADKSTSSSSSFAIKQNKKLAEELNKPIIKNF